MFLFNIARRWQDEILKEYQIKEYDEHKIFFLNKQQGGDE
jgi:hypothetical protein